MLNQRPNPKLPKTAHEIETTCACGEKKSAEFESCFACYELQRRHHDYLFDNNLFEYLPQPDNCEPIGDEYLLPMNKKTYNEYWQLLADYMAAEDTPPDWSFERDLMKLQTARIPTPITKKEAQKEYWTGKTQEEMRAINKSIDRHERRHNAI